MTEATNTANAEAEAAAKKAAAEKEKADKKAAKKAESEAKKAAKVQAKADAKKAKDEAKAASKQPEQNGIRRPKAGTITGKLWDLFDKLSRDTGKPATIGDSMKGAEGTAEATVRTQYARWRKFNGVTGRATPEAPPAAPAA